MIFESLPFWLVLAAIACVFILARPEWVRLRAAALIAGSVAVLALVLDLSAWSALVLLLCLAWITFAVRLAATSPRGAASLLVLLAPVALVWVGMKLAAAAHIALFQFVGLSYLFIKAWTLLKDVRDKRVQDPDALVVIAYFLHFPTFVSGPMHLYSEFERSVRTPAFPSGRGYMDAVFRILLGLVKVKLLAPLLLPISLDALVQSGPLTVTTLATASVAYSIVIWANFSGYSDLAIASSRLMGIDTPENFNYPYLAPNIREFWQRWHITFTRVLTSYVFIPLSRSLGRRIGDRPRMLMIAVTALTFLFCGFWHGAALNFLLWGLYNALGLIVYDFYRPGAMRRRVKRKGKPGAAATAVAERALGTALTFAFVSAGWIFFVLPASRLLGA